MQDKRVFGMVLAAGLGTRMRPLTNTVPKPAIVVGGKPLLFYALENMQVAGVSRVVINTHYLPEQIIQIVNTRQWPFEVIFVHEPVILGTGGALRNAYKYLEGCDAILTHNSDSIVDFDLTDLVSAHLKHSPISTMLLKSVLDPDAFGAVASDEDDRIRDIVGLADYHGKVHKRRMYCGVQVFSPKLFEWMPKEGAFCILRQVIIPAIRSGALVRAVEHSGFFCDVGTLERLDFANRYFAKES